jgi:DNA-binding NarL/FixJ family response regulator
MVWVKQAVGGNGLRAALGILAIDPVGDMIEILRSLDLGTPVWRASRSSELDAASFHLVVLAVYDQVDWKVVAQLSAEAPLVLLSVRLDRDDECRAMALGAFGYVDSSISRDAMRRSFEGALRGEPAYARRVLSVLMKRSSPHTANLPLTPRQREVVLLIAKGAADKEIAKALGITTATAQKHVTNLLKRLNVPNRAAAAALISASR